jgi:hypothetical protein
MAPPHTSTRADTESVDSQTFPASSMLGEIQTVPRRPRRNVSPVLLTLLRPLLRFSFSRDAYVLRLGGDRFGPVLRAKVRHAWDEVDAR